MNRHSLSLVATLVFIAILGLFLLGIAVAAGAADSRGSCTVPCPAPGPALPVGGGR